MGVQNVFLLSIFIKKSVKLKSIIRKINDELRVLCLLRYFHFVLNENITRSYLCVDGVHLTEAATELFAGNIINFLNDFILNVNVNGFVDWHNTVYSEEKEKTKNLSENKKKIVLH